MRNLLSLTILITLSAALLGCGRGSSPGSREKTAVRVGFVPVVSQAVPLIGASRGPDGFRNSLPSVDLQYKAFHTDAEIVEAMRAGSLDVAFIGPAPLVTAFWKSADVVALGGSSLGGAVLVARRESNIDGVEDLDGKKVAVPALGDSCDVLLRYQMALSGLRPADKGGKVEVLPTALGDLPRLLSMGQLDAACVPEPWASRLERGMGVDVVLGSAAIFNEGNYPAAVIAARKEFVDANPDAARAFADAAKALAERLAEDRETFIPALTDEIRSHAREDVSEDDVARSLRRCAFSPVLTQHMVHVFANLVEVAGYKEDPTATLDGVIWLPPATPEGPPAP